MSGSPEGPRDWPAAIRAASERIAPYVRATPAVRSERLSTELSAEVHLKLETLQETGSFKVRGAFAKLTALDPRPERVRAASTGNHGLAVARAAAVLGVRATVHVPSGADPAKLARIARLGAEVVVSGADCLAAETAARAAARAGGEPYVSPYNDPEVVAGQGTVALELARDLAPCDLVAVAVGGGGLAGGIAAALAELWPSARVVGCSPERSAVLARSIALGRAVADEGLATLSDATAGGVEQGSLTLELCARGVAHWMLVGEHEIAAEMRAAWRDGLAIEGAAAVALAGLRRAARALGSSRAVAILCGGNVSPEVLGAVLAGAGAEGDERPLE